MKGKRAGTAEIVGRTEIGLQDKIACYAGDSYFWKKCYE